MKHLLLVLFSSFFLNGIAQKKQEQEFRITKNELSKTILPLLSEYMNGAKRLRYYKELDHDKSSYEVKFKKDRLFYSVEFDDNGQLEDVEFIIKEIDIPEATLKNLKDYLSGTHGKFRIKKIQQQYLNKENNPAEVLRIAFQNLVTPEINYELIVATKDDTGFSEYEITFNADGQHLLTRKSVAPKYDHVLFQ